MTVEQIKYFTLWAELHLDDEDDWKSTLIDVRLTDGTIISTDESFCDHLVDKVISVQENDELEVGLLWVGETLVMLDKIEAIEIVDVLDQDTQEDS